MEEEWKHRLLQRADDMGSKSPVNRTTMWGTRLAMRTTPTFLAVIHGCAKARDMNISSYVRRAVAKQVAKDLGVPWERILEMTPFPSSYNGSRAKRMENGIAVPDTGEGFGDWS